MCAKIVGEIGINAQGDINTALELCSMAKRAGADYVKFQVRNPEICVPPSQWNIKKQTPWGTIEPYIDYRKKMEFSRQDFHKIETHCDKIDIEWFASVWDEDSLDMIVDNFYVPFVKIPSAMMNNNGLQFRCLYKHDHMIVSTGMATEYEVKDHCDWLLENVEGTAVTLMACHSAYPTPEEETNLSVINTLKNMYPQFKVGFSSHSPTPMVPILSLPYDPEMIEVHITLDRTMIGSDHAASLEEKGLALLVREAKRYERIKGDGKIRLYDSEMSAREKMRYVQ